MAWAEFRETKTGTARRFHKVKKVWQSGSWYVIGRDRNGGSISEPAGEWANVKATKKRVEELEGMDGGSGMTLADAYETYKNVKLKQQKSPLTWPAYKNSIDKFLSFMGGARKLASIKREDLKRFLLSLLEEFCQNGMLVKMGHVRTFITFFYKEGVLKENPAQSITAGYKKTKVATYLTDEQIVQVLECVDNPQYVRCAPAWSAARAEFKDLLWTALMTGMRIAEVINFRCSWVQDDKIYLVNGKGDKSRIIPIVPQLADILRRYLARGHDRVFHGWSIDRVKERWPKLYGRAQKKIPNLPPRCRFHDLRHTFAKNALRNGIGLKQLQLIMGHANVSTTGDVYGDLDAEALVADMKKFKVGFLEPALIRVV